MSSVRPVPETRCMPGEELSFTDARQALRQHGGLALVRAAFVRFRYGDGFSHARGFGLQLALATVPLIIAMTGLAGALGADRVSEVVARTAVALSPATSDPVVEEVVEGPDGSAADVEVEEDDGELEVERENPRESAGEIALWVGLGAAFLAMTTGFAQLERGANRIYGTKRDRPALAKYGRAALLAVTAGTALGAGFLLLVAGGPFGNAVESVYDWSGTTAVWWGVLRWPVGLLLLLAAVTALFRFAPRRQQPGLTWLAVGAGATVLGWLGTSGLLAWYVAGSQAFGDTYGPLTAVMALLLWAYVSGIALLGGVALAAQLEAVRAGQDDPLLPDRDEDGIPDDLERHAEAVDR